MSEIPDEIPSDAEFTTEMVERLRDIRDTAGEMETSGRSDAGWVRFYVECIDCGTPMARTGTESVPVSAPDGEKRSKTRYTCICPDCGALQTDITVYRHTHAFGQKVRRSD